MSSPIRENNRLRKTGKSERAAVRGKFSLTVIIMDGMDVLGEMHLFDYFMFFS